MTRQTVIASPGQADALPPEERRWVTVLLADISGFTSTSERLDPEDVKTLVSHSLNRVGEQIDRFGGTVVNVMGDAVLAVFGAPVAHEDDAARAVRAAIALREISLTDNPTYPLKLHFGINTGEVLATVYGAQEQRSYSVLGDTVNTADRILKAAPAGSVLVGEETYRATRHVVRYRQLTPVVAKGKHPANVLITAMNAVGVPGPLGEVSGDIPELRT